MLNRRAFRSDMQARHSGFYSSIAIPAAGAVSYGSYDEEVSDLFEKIGALQEAALLPAVGADLDDLNALVSHLPADLAQVRQRGFVHQAELEQQVADLTQRWDQLYERIADALYQRQNELVEGANRLLDMVDRLYEPGASRGIVDSCWSGVRALQSRIEDAHRGLTAMYDDFSAELDGVEQTLARVDWMLDQVDEAKFDLLEGEAPLRAAGVRWMNPNDPDGEQGILYLTDQRLLFERKEEEVTAKFLFIATKKETRHQFRFDAPITSIETVEVGEQRKGLLGMNKQELLELRFDHTAQLENATFQLLKDAVATWVGLIGQVQSGSVDRARTEVARQEAVSLDEVKSAIPTNCPNCSAPIDQTILRGQKEITCQYCGSVIRL